MDSHTIELTPGWEIWRRGAVRGAGMPLSWLDWFAEDPLHGGEAAAREVSAAAVRAVLREPRFVEAVTWQNPGLVKNWLGEHVDRLAAGKTSLAHRDKREALIAFLAQRYCAKNETIGFFGPVAWATFDTEARGLTQVGSGDLRSRTLFVEDWAARALAAAFAAEETLFEHLIVRRHPACAFRDDVVLRPARRPRPLAPTEAALLAVQRDGMRVGDLLAAVPEGRIVLSALCDDGVLAVGIPLPLDGDPCGALEAYLHGLPHGTTRDGLLARYARFRTCLEEVRAAAGDPALLREALSRTELVFAELTGTPGRRDKTRSRYGRALVYEDCRRDTDIVVGADLLAALRAPLGLLLDSARWFVAELGAEVEHDLLDRYERLAGAGREVSLADLVLASGDVFNGLPGTAVERVVADFMARWAEVLSLAVDGRLSSATATPMVRALFAAQPVPWRAAIQHSPDLMLSLTDSGFQWVLGELHLALNTLESRPFVTQSDDPDAMLAATASDHACGRIVPRWPHHGVEVTARTYPPLAMDQPSLYTYWSYSGDDGHRDGAPSLPGAGLRVGVLDGSLVAVEPVSGVEGDVLEFVGEFLTGLAVSRFRLRQPAPHQRRLYLDDVVIARESWRAALADLPAQGRSYGDYRHGRLRDWLAGLGTPRHVFARVTGNPKPFLVDRHSPLSLRGLARATRGAAERHPEGFIELTEMLPGPDGLWLTDKSADRYTSELRLVAVDRWQTPQSPVRKTS